MRNFALLPRIQNNQQRNIRRYYERYVATLGQQLAKYQTVDRFVLGGINDIDKHISKNEIVDNIDKIVTAIKGVNPDCRIIVQSIYPVNENIRPRYLNKVHNRNNQAVREVNVELEKICQDRGCVYVDVYSLLADEEGNLNKLYTRDGLHLIKKGYFAVADIIKPYLAQSE